MSKSAVAQAGLDAVPAKPKYRRGMVLLGKNNGQEYKIVCVAHGIVTLKDERGHVWPLARAHVDYDFEVQP